jgi:hypothetical protein
MRKAVVVLTMLLLGSLGAAAQNATPTPRPETLFPSVVDLGSGRGQLVFDVPLEPYPYLDRFAGASYIGPKGSRIHVMYVAVANGPEATSKAWPEAEQLVADWGESFTIDEAIQEKLDSTPPVAGCSDMRRLQGKDLISTRVMIGVSLCAVDTDVYVVALVSGWLDGLEGHQASDRVVELVLESSGLS